MPKKQLVSLSIINLVVFSIGSGLVPILPIYALRLGIRPDQIGYFMAFSFFLTTIGSIIAGRLSDKYQNRKTLLLISTILFIPFTIWIGQVSTLWMLAFTVGVVWFFAGVIATLVSILVGIFVDEKVRGITYGILAMTIPLGAIIGGSTIGLMVDAWGYPKMFIALGIFSILSPLIVGFVKDEKIVQQQTDDQSAKQPQSDLSASFYYLFFSNAITATVVFLGRFGTSLSMDAINFSTSAVSSTTTIGGLIGLPLPFVFGWLSDRVERKRLLAVFYLFGGLGIFVLSRSVTLSNFLVAAGLISILAYTPSSVGSALVNDIVPKKSLGRGLSLFGATAWLGGILGFGGAGLAFEYFGVTTTYTAAIILTFFALILLVPIKKVQT